MGIKKVSASQNEIILDTVTFIAYCDGLPLPLLPSEPAGGGTSPKFLPSSWLLLQPKW